MTGARNVIFEDRADAGRRLARSLEWYAGSGAIIMAIPRGGVPVAAAAAEVLGLKWNVIVTRKLPIPWNPEAGFGAVAADGSVVLNEQMLHGLRLRAARIDEVMNEVRAEVTRRTEAYSKLRPTPDLSGKVVIVLDDGLASGYTMLAAIKSIRAQGLRESWRRLRWRPSRRPSCSKARPTNAHSRSSALGAFAVADFYLQWRDLTDDDIEHALRSGERV